jgi:hypothetical protein
MNKKLHKFRFLFYSLKFKQQFRKWLWEGVREKKVMTEMAPAKIEKMLSNGMSLDDILIYIQQKLQF